MRKFEEIEAMMDKALDIEGTRVKGMTYEQGVSEALRWALKFSDDPPIGD